MYVHKAKPIAFRDRKSTNNFQIGHIYIYMHIHISKHK